MRRPSFTIIPMLLEDSEAAGLLHTFSCVNLPVTTEHHSIATAKSANRNMSFSIDALLLSSGEEDEDQRPGPQERLNSESDTFLNTQIHSMFPFPASFNLQMATPLISFPLPSAPKTFSPNHHHHQHLHLEARPQDTLAKSPGSNSSEAGIEEETSSELQHLQGTDQLTEASGDEVDPSASSRTRRRRTAFTHAQLQFLEKRFHCQKYLSVGDRSDISELLNLSETQVKTWYQNRRTKWKRQTTAAMRAEQLRKHVCDDENCVGRRQFQGAPVSPYCPKCLVVNAQKLATDPSFVPRVYLKHMQMHIEGCHLPTSSAGNR